MRIRPLSRRTFLRGTAGALVALPTLEIMLNPRGDAYANGAPLPKRFAIGFGGHALGGDFDSLDNELVPDIVGPGYDLKRASATLANNGNVTDRVSIVSGLRIPYDDGYGIPAGGWGKNFHTQGLCPLFSGQRSAGPDDYRIMGPSADQVVRGWLAQTHRASRLQLPDHVMVDAVTAARCELLLNGPFTLDSPGDPQDDSTDPAA